MSGNLVSVFRKARGHGVSVRPWPDPTCRYMKELTVNSMIRLHTSLVPRLVGVGSGNETRFTHNV